MTLATPVNGVFSVLDRLRARWHDAVTASARPRYASPIPEGPIAFESWRLVCWDDETVWRAPTPGICDRDPVATRRTERNRRDVPVARGVSG